MYSSTLFTNDGRISILRDIGPNEDGEIDGVYPFLLGLRPNARLIIDRKTLPVKGALKDGCE